MIVEYVGRRKMQYRTLEAVRVIDTKFGRQRLAYFDAGDSLLYAEVEGRRRTTYQQYRETRGVLTPFEIGGGYRWHTELNTGLTPDRFEVPEQVSWEPEWVRIVVFEHAPVPPGGPAALRLQVEELTQGELPPDDLRAVAMQGRIVGGVPWLGRIDWHLLDTYMKRKLQAAGVLAGADPPEWRLSWRVEEFRVVVPPGGGRPVMATIRIAVRVQSLTDEGLWEGEVRHRWEVLTHPPIDDEMADYLTFQGISRASAGIKQLLDARDAAAQPAPTPSAGSNSGSE